MDPWKHEDRPSLGCESLLSSRTSRGVTIESLTRDRTVSWVRIVNGINKYVTDTSEEIPIASVEKGGTGEPVARRLNHDQNLFSRSLLCPFLVMNENGQTLIQEHLVKVVSKITIRLLRHDDTVSRVDDGAVRFDDLAEKFKAKFGVHRNGHLKLR